MKIGPLLPKLS